MADTINLEVATRLRRFGKATYGTMASFADALGMTPSALNSSYLSGRSLPGAYLLLILHSSGCDINWLLTGKGRAPLPSKQELDSWEQLCTDELEVVQATRRLSDLSSKLHRQAPTD